VGEVAGREGLRGGGLGRLLCGLLGWGGWRGDEDGRAGSEDGEVGAH